MLVVVDQLVLPRDLHQGGLRQVVDLVVGRVLQRTRTAIVVLLVDLLLQQELHLRFGDGPLEWLDEVLRVEFLVLDQVLLLRVILILVTLVGAEEVERVLLVGVLLAQLATFLLLEVFLRENRLALQAPLGRAVDVRERRLVDA